MVKIPLSTHGQLQRLLSKWMLPHIPFKEYKLVAMEFVFSNVLSSFENFWEVQIFCFSDLMCETAAIFDFEAEVGEKTQWHIITSNCKKQFF